MLNEAVVTKQKFKIKVDESFYEFENSTVTGGDILATVGKFPIECFSLYQKYDGCDFEKICIDEKVDLSKPGIEKFTIKESEVFYYTIDGESETTEKKFLTANEILALNAMNGEEYYLVQILPDGSQISYKDNPNSTIEMNCTGLKFIAAYKSATPVA